MSREDEGSVCYNSRCSFSWFNILNMFLPAIGMPLDNWSVKLTVRWLTMYISLYLLYIIMNDELIDCCQFPISVDWDSIAMLKWIFLSFSCYFLCPPFDFFCCFILIIRLLHGSIINHICRENKLWQFFSSSFGNTALVYIMRKKVANYHYLIIIYLWHFKYRMVK